MGVLAGGGGGEGGGKGGDVVFSPSSYNTVSYGVVRSEEEQNGTNQQTRFQ